MVYVYLRLVMPPTSVGRGQYEMIGVVYVCLCHASRMERPRKPGIGRMEAQHP